MQITYTDNSTVDAGLIDSYTKSQIDTIAGGKVDKVTGYSLIADTSITRLANTSGNNTGDQDISGLLKLDQTTPQTLTGTFTFPNIKGNIPLYTETLTDLGTVSSGTVTLDCAVSRNWKVTIGGAVTLAFSNVPTGAFVTPLTLRITMPVAYTITYPASVKWNYGIIPTLSTTKKNKITFVTSDDGTTFDSGKVGEY